MDDDTSRYNAPAGWPLALPPGAPDWEREAVAWLWERVPADWHRHEVLERNPALLARLARQEAEARLNAARTGFRTLRVDMREVLEPHAIEEAVAMEAERGAALREAARQVHLVEEALRGVRWRRGAAERGRRRGGMG